MSTAVTHEPVLSPLGIIELRYVRKAVRYRLFLKGIKSNSEVGIRTTPPAGKNTAKISRERRRELDVIADWIVRKEW